MQIYKLIMNNGKEILFDETEIEIVRAGMADKVPFVLKQGLVNPSYVMYDEKVEQEKILHTFKNPETGKLETKEVNYYELHPLENIYKNTKKLKQ